MILGVRIFGSFSFLLLILSCSAGPAVSQKIRGVSFVSSRDTINQTHVSPVLNTGANYAAVMPFGFMRSSEEPQLIFNTDGQWFGERYLGAKQYIRQLHQNNIEVMLKPQIWIRRGEFTGDLLLKTEEDWELLEDSYEAFILLYAGLAEEEKVAIYCIGTELYNFTAARPEFWQELIEKVKKVYSGKLTYAENWDKVGEVAFWKELDFIGADAYFPVSEMKTPTTEAARQGWQTHKTMLKNLSRKLNKPVLFTEYGYRSIDYAGKEPWDSRRTEESANMEAQANLYEALFQELWKEPWFAGGFVWKWFHDYERTAARKDNRFTPQGKPAEVILKKWYSL